MDTFSTLLSQSKDYFNRFIDDDPAKGQKYKYLAVGSISALTILSIWRYFHIQSKNKQNEELDVYFSHTYHSARDKFRKAASKISMAKQHQIVIDTESDLSIDLCFIPGDNDSKHLMVHFCGTHGSEGFAGSAIQIHLLQNEIPKMIKNLDNTYQHRPNILLIHPLNPFGMAHNRRWNKANIDLNRNCILKQEIWDDVKNRDLSNNAYKELNDLINPKRKPAFWRDDVGFWFEALSNILMYGMGKLKKAVVEGQYFEKEGIFYGGNGIAMEHKLLVKCLKEQSGKIFGIDLCKMTEKLTLIDVHTGLGKYGQDTLLTDQDGKELHRLYPRYVKENRILDFGTEGFWKEMYKDTIGNVTDSDVGYNSLFVNATDRLIFAEEFGTVSPVMVFKAMRAENMAYHYSQGESLKDEKIFYQRGIDCKRVFYAEDDPFWKRQVLKSGVHVFKQSLWR